MNPTPFHRLIRNRRRELGRTQREIASAIGIASADFISLVEQGRRRLHLNRVPALAQILELDPALLCRQALEASAPQLAAHLFGGTEVTQ